MTQFKKKVLAVFLIVFMVGISTPLTMQAVTISTYQPQNQQQWIAYLQGRIAQLQLMIQQAEKSGLSLNPSQSTLSFVSIETHKALDVEETTAILRGEAVIYGNTSATVWFEYGKDINFLDQRTGKVTVKTAYERAVRTTVSKLEDDRKYYFRIAAIDKSGLVQYGEIFSFTTDETDED